MAEPRLRALHQCRSCPWHVDCVPERDIPGYRVEAHEAVACTIRSGLESLQGPVEVMACHYTRRGVEFPCAGWLEHQLVNDNLAVRMAVMTKRLPMPQTDGPQHKRFEDTLPAARRCAT